MRRVSVRRHIRAHATVIVTFAASIAGMLVVASSVGADAQTVPTDRRDRTTATPSDTLGDLVTDRPDFTESSEVVGAGVVQLEVGFTLEGDSGLGGRSRGVRVPAALMRVGVGPRVELRFSGTGFVSAWPAGRSGSRVSGYADVDVGAKVQLLGHPALALAVIPSLSIPTGQPQISSRTYDPTMKVTWALPLVTDVSLAGNVNVSYLSDAQRRYIQRAASLSLSHPLFGDWGAYWEAYGLTAIDGPRSAPGWTVNGGVTRLVGRDIQLDVEVGRGITARAPDWFIASGFAVRHPFARRSRAPNSP